MARRIDPARIKGEIVEYYDKRPLIGDAWDGEPIGTFPDPGPEMARWQADLQEVVRGRRTLELACGTGSGTRVATETATSILAIDSGESCVRLARERTSLPHVEFLVADAFDLTALPSDFEAAFACGFFHLIPKARYDEFLAGFHAKLRPGAPVFLQASHTRTIRAKKREFRVADCDDVFCSRSLADGSTYDIVNNPFDTAILRAIFEPRVRDFDVHVGDAWWWITYRL
jgi:SAM-dependent methyltransferase